MTQNFVVLKVVSSGLNGVSAKPQASPGGLGGEANQMVSTGMSYDTPCLQGTNNPNQTHTNQTTQPPQTKTQNIKIKPTIKKPRKRTKPILQTCITFNQIEHSQLQNDSNLTGQSIPQLFKNAYFRKNNRAQVIPKTELVSLHLAYREIANTLNAVDEKMNAGVRDGFHPEFDHIKRIVSDLHSTVMRHHGLY